MSDSRPAGAASAAWLLLSNKALLTAFGLLFIFLVPRFLSPTAQGFYYLFQALIALQVLAEMGLNYAVMQVTSHAVPAGAAKRLLAAPSAVEPEMLEALGKAKGILQFVLAWYGLGALLLIAILCPAGYFFMMFRGDVEASKNILVPWVALVIASAAVLFLNGLFAVAEGAGLLLEVAKVRAGQVLLSNAVGAGVLVLGGALYALPAAAFATLVVGAWFAAAVVVKARPLYAAARALPTTFHWKRDILPFQLPLAISWLAGYLAFQAIVPLVYFFLGANEAGRVGLSLQIATAINGVSIVWISSRAPVLGQLAARGSHAELLVFFKRLLQQSVFVLAGCIAALSIALGGDFPIVGTVLARALPVPLLTLLIIAAIGNHFTFAFAIFLRSFLSEPLLKVSVVTGVLTLVLVCLLTLLWGNWGPPMAYMLASVAVSLPASWHIYRTKVRSIHSAESNRVA